MTENPYVQQLKTFFILFLILGGLVAAVSGIAYGVSASANFGAGDLAGEAGAAGWFALGGSLIGFGLLASLFYLAAASTDWRLMTPQERQPVVPASAGVNTDGDGDALPGTAP